MSSRRTRATTITDDELTDLVSKLRALLPNNSSRCTTRVPSSKVLKETCDYIKKLHREVDNLSDRLSHLLDSMEGDTQDAEILRNLLQQ